MDITVGGDPVPRMVRKQVYIEPEQETLLKRRSRELAVSEAALIRRGIEQAARAGSSALPDLKAWEAARRFIQQRLAIVAPQTGRTWTREELYEERLERFLVDSNVLVSVHDPRDHAKQKRALAVLDALIPRGLAVLSVQCLTEFLHAARWRLLEPLPPEDALAQVERFVPACPVLDLTPMVVLEGCRGSNAHSLSL